MSLTNKVIVFSGVVLAVGCVGFFVRALPARAATLALSPVSGSYTVGQNFSLTVNLNTQGANTDGVDLHYLRFNKTYLELKSATPGALYANTLTNVIDNVNGTYNFSQVSSGGAHYNGSGVLLTLNFQAKAIGTAVVSFDFTVGSSLDCNVAVVGADVLGAVTNGSYTIAAAPDITPPATITNLAVSSRASNSITLTWTSPGDDGAVGLAMSYDLRRSNAIINDGNWAGATLVTGEPAPQAAGTSQSMMISGLASGTTYYFALKTSDEIPNISALSNVVSGTTDSPDTTAPAAVTNLTAGSATGSSITLTWTASGDDGVIGTAASYDVRYSTSQITEANWAGASQVAGESVPQVSGTSQTMIVGSLLTNTTYFFALKISDEALNISGVSNSPSAMTITILDTTKPVISGVQSSGAYYTGATVAWTTDEPATAQVDYGVSAGYGNSTILNASLQTSHSENVTNVNPATSYHYRVRSKDAAGNEAVSGDYTFVTASTQSGGGGGGTLPYGNGAFLKSPDNTIYLIDNSQKRRIISADAFDSCKYNWASVVSVEQSVIDQYVNGADFNGCTTEIILVKTANDSAVYQISKGTKRHLPSIEVFNSYGYAWSGIQTITQAQLDAYPRTELIKTDQDPKTYHFSTTRVRRWLASSAIFDGYGYQWDKLVIINDTEMAVYPDCRVIKTVTSPDVYMLSNNKRKITSIDAYNTLGYRWEDIDIVSQLEMDFYTTGEPYSI